MCIWPGGLDEPFMCNTACLEFGQEQLTKGDVCGKTVLEIGARNVNGSLRSFVEGLSPSQYIGVDVEAGPGVDEICRAEELPARFGDATFDLVISTELVEHVRDWRRVITNFKSVLRPNGVLLLTTRSHGFPYHGYPHDYWRYELADIREIFSDFLIEALMPDPSEPGVFVKARKPTASTARDLSGIRLHSMIAGRRVRVLKYSDLFAFRYANWREAWRTGKRPESLRRLWLVPLARLRQAVRWQPHKALLPFGCIDTPKPGDQAIGEVRLAGWALCDDPIVEISVYLDRQFAVLGSLYGSRPDVRDAFPKYRFGETSGWSASVDLTGLPGGEHELTVLALTSAGASSSVGAVRVTIHSISGAAPGRAGLVGRTST